MDLTKASDDINGQKPFEIHQIFDAVHYIDDFMYISNIVFFLIGIPLNLMVIGAIVLLKRLHLPRILLWIGTGFSNIFILTTGLMVSLSVRLGSPSSTRTLFFLLAVFSFSYQTLNIIFAQLERHVCINHPILHKKLFTTLTIPIIQLLSFLVFISILIGITNLEVFREFLAQFFSSWYFTLVATIVFGILPIFLIGQLAVSRCTLAPKNVTTIKIASKISPSPQSIFSLEEKQTNKTRKPIESTNHHPSPLPMISRNIEKQKKTEQECQVSRFVRIGSNRISRLDLESHRTFSFLTKAYLLFVIIPHSLSFVLVFGCLQWFADDADESRCSSFVQSFYYVSIILTCLNSSVVNPVGFVALSSDLMSTLKARIHRKSPIAKELLNHDIQETSNI